MRQQHVAFEYATAMTELETAVALARAAAAQPGDLMKAQSRLWASQVALGVPARILAALAASNGLGADDLGRLQALGNLEGALALQTGRLADMNLVAERITGMKVGD